MKAGFFFNVPVDIDLLESIAAKNEIELVGAFFKNCNGFQKKSTKIIDYADELLVQVETAYIFYDISEEFNFIAKAIKRGVNVFLGSLPNSSYSVLSEINSLSLEIGIPVGFGCSGESLIRTDEIIGNYFLLQLKHDMGCDINNDVFRRRLIYDIASFVRIKPCGLKKLRVNGIPLFSKSPKSFMLRLEYDNSSVITSCITRIDEPIKRELRFFSGDDGYLKELPVENVSLKDGVLNEPSLLLNDKCFLANISLYTNEIRLKTPLSFGLDNALETLSIFETIEQRLLPQA